MQAAGVAEWLGSHPVAAVHASPRRRTMETAMIIASAVGGEVAQAEALDEIDFGRWNGRSFAELEDDPLWSAWNRHRSIASTPGGETMAQAVERTVQHLESLAAAQPGQALLCVTHCDIIRGTLAHYLGLSLDNIFRFDIDPGSISTIEIGADGTRVTRINEVAA